MEINQRHLNGAKQVIRKCLGLQPGQNLLIFADETTNKLVLLLSEAALYLGVIPTIIFVPTSQQRNIPLHFDLSDLIQNAARDARGILTCVSSAPECLPFRNRILESHWDARTRIGHMPGASSQILKLADVNFDQLVENCFQLSLAMARGKTIEFFSYSRDGEEHVLTAELGAWQRIPVPSDGIIMDGVWGNVPSGETYIAPIEGTAQGSVIINGSIPNMIVGQKNEFVINFENGHAVNIEPSDNPTSRWLYKSQIEIAQQNGDLNWSNLAEIGIGVNPGNSRLTGKMLFDEKCAGTAHIALGDNMFMGGIAKSTIHCDMVIKNPTILINRRPILDRGKLVVMKADWFDNYREVDIQSSVLAHADRVSYSGTQVDLNNGQLKRMLRSEPGRIINYPVGEIETSKIAFKVFDCLPSDNSSISLIDLEQRTSLTSLALKQTLHVMNEFELIKFS